MPKTKLQNGIVVTSNTALDNLGQVLTGFMQQQLAQHKERIEAQVRADEAQQQQAVMRTKLADIANDNPDLYNQLVKDPTIRSFMDVGRPAAIMNEAKGSLFDQFQARRQQNRLPKTADVNAGTGVALSEIPEDSPTMQKYRLQQKAAAAKANSEISTSQLQGMVANYRAGKLSSDDLVSQLEGMTGGVPSVQDVAVAGGQVSPEAAAAAVPGTLAWKKNQSNQLLGDIATKYSVQNPSDLQKLRAYSEWTMGLRDQPPDKLPDSFAQMQADMDQKSYNLRVQQFHFDQAQYQESQRQHTLSAAWDMTRYGVDPNVAIGAADTFLKTGKMPPGVTLAPDKKAELDEKMTELRYEKLQQDMQAAVVKDPEMESLVKILQQIPEKDRAGTPYYKRMRDKMASAFGWQVNNPSTWNTILNKATFGMVKADPGVDFSGAKNNPNGTGVVVKPGGVRTTTTTKSETKAEMTPELVNSGNTVATQAMQVYTSLAPADKQKLRPLMSALADAQDNGDVAGTAKAIQELQDALKVLQVR